MSSNRKPNANFPNIKLNISDRGFTVRNNTIHLKWLSMYKAVLYKYFQSIGITKDDITETSIRHKNMYYTTIKIQNYIILKNQCFIQSGCSNIEKKATWIACKKLLNQFYQYNHADKSIIDDILQSYYTNKFQKIKQTREQIKQRKSIKSRFCRNWINGYQCRFGNECNFAHSVEELTICPSFNAADPSKECKDGVYCLYAHNTKQEIELMTKYKNNNPNCLHFHNHNQPIGFKKIKCKYYIVGQCRNGLYCKYYHPIPTPIPNEWGPTSYCSFYLSGMVCPDGIYCKYAHHKDEMQTCRYYLNGYCKYGTSCRFRHPVLSINHKIINAEKQSQNEKTPDIMDFDR